MTITFFDIACKEPVKPWNPNCFKARHALRYKGINFETKWLHYTEIKETLKGLGVKPTSQVGGEDFWTCPAIYDSETKQYIANSIDIAEYLDEKYPQNPLIPQGCKAATHLFDGFVLEKIVSALAPAAMAPSNNVLTPEDQEYFRGTRESWFGKKLEELCPEGAARDEAWTKFKTALDTLASFYDKNKKDSYYFYGDKLSYADFVLASFVVWFKETAHSEFKWEEFESWNGGRWALLLKETAAYRV